MIFGPAWSRRLVAGAESIGVPFEWVLAVLALESEFDPNARNDSGARGLWQRMPREVSRVEMTKAPPALGPLDFTRANRDGSTSVMRYYPCPAPEVQLADAFAFWSQMIAAFHVGSPTSREAFYTLNLAPARLKNGRYDGETVLYEAPGAAYRANAAPFGLDPGARTGAIHLRHIAVGLDRAIHRCRARYDAESEAAQSVLADAVQAPREHTENVQPGVGVIELSRGLRHSSF